MSEDNNVNKYKSAWVDILLIFSIFIFSFVSLYFYRPQILSFLNSVEAVVVSGVNSGKNLIQKDEIVGKLSSVNCGITNSPDRNIPNSYTDNDVLKCLGESAMSCIDAKATIADPLFPTIFKIYGEKDNCNFSLSYPLDSTLVDIFDKKLSGRSISCPISAVKGIDETDPNNVLFKKADTTNMAKYATDMYFYGVFTLFIENNFDKDKIAELGCTGDFIDSVIESYNLNKIKS